MKKSLIALAVLAASGASFAQSTVTVYGLADLWVGSVKTENGAGGSATTTMMESGGVNTSRWGLKGSEDLGGGLKANFLFEQKIAVDTGTASGFSRYAYVGFSGGFGEVKLGKTGTAYDDVSGASDAMFDSGALAPMNIIFNSTTYDWNPANTIYYTSPSFSGFSGAFSYSLDEKVATAAAITSFNLAYAAGPIAAQFGYQSEDLKSSANDTAFLRLGASYNFGMATAKFVYGKVTDVGNVNGADTSEYQIGVDYPVSPVLTLSASYARSDDNATAGDQTRKGFGVAGAYTLSKRTFLYGGYTNNSFSQAGSGDSKVSAFAVGVQHKF